MKKIKVGINGFGRIGRAFLKVAWERPEIEIVAVNDLGSVENMAYLLKYDTVYKKWEHDIKVEGQDVIIDGETILLGVNEEKFGTCDITSNASCTTNAASPLIAILDETLGIEKAILNTVHGYTASQALVDGPSKKDFREGRAAAQNIVPSSTGAAIAVTKAFTKLSGLFDGISIRVPVVAGSIVDVTFISKKQTTKEEVNEILKKAAQDKRWECIFSATEEELVSSDILGSPYGSIADLALTRVIGGNLVKVMGWYDNEMGYTYTLVDHVIKTGRTI